MKQAFSPGIHVFRPQPKAKFRLLCFSNAGGDGLLFRNWSRYLDSQIEVGLLCLPGRGTRYHEPFIRNISPLLEILDNDSERFLSKPFVFFGHSFGGLLAFELTRMRRAKGKSLPRLLFASACSAPHKLTLALEGNSKLPQDKLLERLRAFGGIPDHLLKHPDYLEAVLEIVRADLEVMESYRYKAKVPLECPIMAMGGQHDPSVDKSFLEAWADQTIGEFQIQWFEGDHFFLQKPSADFFQILNQKILSCL